MEPPPPNHHSISDHIDEEQRKEWEKTFPGLLNDFDRARRGDIDREDFIRSMLKSMRNDQQFDNRLKGFDDDVKEKLQSFMDGKSARQAAGKRFKLPLGAMLKRGKSEEVVLTTTANHVVSPSHPLSHSRLMASRNGAVKGRILDKFHGNEPIPKALPVSGEAQSLAEIESTGTKVAYFKNFKNWGGTVNNTPKHTFTPTNVAGLQAIVKHAKKEGKRVRAAGFRHTWSDMFSASDQVLVSLIDLGLAEGDAYNVLTSTPKDQNMTFEKIVNSPALARFDSIELKDEVAGSNGKKCLARIGAGVTNEQFRLWALKHEWTFPLNVIMVEITVGGANAPICHGAGLQHGTLSDLVRQIEYVDANGEWQTIDNKEDLNAAAGAFGLLGIITHITFELDKMTYAVLNPSKEDVALAIPPPFDYKAPSGYEVPVAAKNIEEERRKAAEDIFKQKAQSYYSEWFWYPYNSRVWVNCWNNTEDETDSQKEYPCHGEVLEQLGEGIVADVINGSYPFQLLSGKTQGWFNGGLAMLRMPPLFGSKKEVKTPLINGLHFRRGIQNFHVLCTEVHIPIPPLATDPKKPDWSIVQKAWWDAIAITNDDKDKTGALRVCLEMRITGSSDIIMAPQKGNRFGTASIEVITNLAAGEENVWQPYVQKLLDAWTSYEVNGVKLNVRPHWAKEWEPYKVGGVEWKTHLKDVSYKEDIPKFKDALSRIGEKHGWTLQDIRNRFSNQLFDYLYFD